MRHYKIPNCDCISCRIKLLAISYKNFKFIAGARAQTELHRAIS